MSIATDVNDRTDRRQVLLRRLAHAWVALLPIQIPLLESGGRDINLAPSDLVLAFALVALLPQIRFRPGVWSVWHFALPIVLTANLALVGVFSRYAVFNKTLGLLILLAAYALLTTVTVDFDDIRQLVRTFVLSVGGLNLVATAAHLLNIGVPFTACPTACVRLNGFLPDPNLYGSILVLDLTGLWFLSRPGRRVVSRSGDIVLQAGLLLGVLLTLSRSAWLALGVVVVGALILGRGAISRWFLWGGLAIGVIAVFLVGDDLSGLVDVAGRTGTVDSRWVLTLDAVRDFVANPIQGIGLGVFAEEHGQIIHNTFLWVLAELGIIGGFALAGFWLWTMRSTVDSYRTANRHDRRMVEAVFLGHLAMFTFSLFVEALYQRHWWLLFALTGSMAVAARAGPKTHVGPAAVN